MVYTKDLIKKYKVGDFTYGTPLVVDRHGGQLEIGKFCSFAPDIVIFLGSNHRTEYITTYPFPALHPDFGVYDKHLQDGPVIIGNDVWIGMGALILPGVNIGDGAVIGAYTVVSKNVDPYSVFVGNPGKVVKKRFEEDVIQELLRIKWWEWDIEKIRENAVLLYSSKVKEFTKKHSLGG